LLASPASAGFRRAGIHGYIYNLLAHLPAAARSAALPQFNATRWHVYTGRGDVPPDPALTVHRAHLDTERPAARIFWEQAVQPFQIGGYDLAHALAFVAPILSRRPFVVTVYDLTFLRYPERLSASRRLYLRLFTGVSCRRAQRVIAISQSTADDLANLLGIDRARIDVAAPGVEPRFAPLPADQVAAFRAARGLPDRFMLFVGTIEPRKNLRMLLHAYAALPAAERQAVPLILAGGKGWMSDDLPALIAQLGLGGSVSMPGYLADSDLVMWYNAADTFVYPSVFEGWGLPVTEAMACGTPVITSAVSSLPEAAGSIGVTLPPDDQAAWTNALHQSIADPAWRVQRSAPGITHARTFTWAATALHTLESYSRALDMGP
jgi:glycosyltransferase involved in cell wall biosynthesis